MATMAGRGSVLDLLRRAPDVEAPELVAVDATDRLLLDEAAAALALCGPGEVAVVDDDYGALTLGAVALHGASDVRVFQDLLVGELALARNAERTGLAGSYRSLPLAAELAAGARVVLVQAPKALDALREIAEVVAATAAPDVTVLVGGRVKHMTHGMNDVLRASFADVSATLARQKSRVLVARGPRPGPSVVPAAPGARRPRADRLRARGGVRGHEDRHRHPHPARLARPDGPGAARRSTSAAAPAVLAAALARSRPGPGRAGRRPVGRRGRVGRGDGGRQRAGRPDHGRPGRRGRVRPRRRASTSSSATRRSTSAPRW